ncbi:MAG: BamA/TamA family outer membrane protein [candidate division KSB1 bacterium]|nr:BamA/TamA family outer membrane protein [candidate division KSB1 bacterium]
MWTRAKAVSLLLVMFFLPSFSQSQVASRENFAFFRSASQRPSGDRALIRKIKRRYFDENARIKEVRGSMIISADDYFERDILVIDGDLRIAGEVEGTVVVINGDVFLRRSARVSGNVVSVNGEVHRTKGAIIVGEIIEATMRTSTPPSRRTRYKRKTYAEAKPGPRHGYREWREKPHQPRYRWKRRTREPIVERWEDRQDAILWRYNRVEGLFLGMNVPPGYSYRHDIINFDVHGFLGYGFASKTWRYRASAELWLFRNTRFLVGGTVYDLTDTRDEWRIPTDENSLAAGLIREDFQDYYRRHGYGVYAAHHLFNVFRARFGMYHDEFESMPLATNWSLFGGDKRFRPNPAIEAGLSRAVKAMLIMDTRDRHEAPRTGWYLQAEAEFSRPDLGSEFDYQRIEIDVRYYWQLNPGENLDIRLRVGSSRGMLPYHYQFFLGGVSTLRAFRYKEFAGNRMLLANIEYRLHSWSDRFREHDLLGGLDLVFFVDLGRAWTATDTPDFFSGFDELTLKNLRADFGIGLTDEEGRVRLNFARRIDGGRKNIVITFRLNRPF